MNSQLATTGAIVMFPIRTKQTIPILTRLIVSVSLGGKAELVVARRTRCPRTWQETKISENDDEKRMRRAGKLFRRWRAPSNRSPPALEPCLLVLSQPHRSTF